MNIRRPHRDRFMGTFVERYFSFGKLNQGITFISVIQKLKTS